MKMDVVEPNFKSKVLSFVTGDFKLFKIPIPMGHIWDSFLRVLLGLIAWNNIWCTTWFVYGSK